MSVSGDATARVWDGVSRAARNVAATEWRTHRGELRPRIADLLAESSFDEVLASLREDPSLTPRGLEVAKQQLLALSMEGRLGSSGTFDAGMSR